MSADDFKGIEEKLKRSSENIDNLHAEINRFFQEGKYPVLPKHDSEALLEAIAYHKNSVVPLRFSVLTGEIVHQLRSCLDHVVWIFSSSEYRSGKHGSAIEFPVFDKEPIDKDKIALYERKVNGVTNPGVLDFIKRLQPYNSPNLIDSPIRIIHKMDVIDKHRELVLCANTGSFEFPDELMTRYGAYLNKHPGNPSAEFQAEIESNIKIVPQISFVKFGRKEVSPIIPSLKHLHDFIVHTMARFESYVR